MDFKFMISHFNARQTSVKLTSSLIKNVNKFNQKIFNFLKSKSHPFYSHSHYVFRTATKHTSKLRSLDVFTQSILSWLLVSVFILRSLDRLTSRNIQ